MFDHSKKRSKKCNKNELGTVKNKNNINNIV